MRFGSGSGLSPRQELPARLTEGAVFPAGWPAWFFRYRRAEQEQIVPAGCTYFQNPFGVFLAGNIINTCTVIIFVFPAVAVFIQFLLLMKKQQPAVNYPPSAPNRQAEYIIHHYAVLIPQPAFLTDGQPALPVIFRGRTGVLPKDLIPRKLIIFC